jgi:SH3-like domain-containing protein
VKFIPTFLFRSAAIALCLASALFFAGCNRGRGHVLEIAYVSGVQANLRDRVAAVYEKAGVVKNGERVEVLDHDRHFVKVRTATGVTGWMEQRYLVSEEVFDRIQKLAADNQNDPVQAQGAARNDTNLHVEPGRDTEHLYQISSGEKLSLLKRGTAEKTGAVAPPSRSATPSKPGRSPQKSLQNNNPQNSSPQNISPQNISPQNSDKKQPVPVIEDWWLVRDSHSRVGWVLARMIDLDIPLDVAQYAEGQRIVAFFVLNQVQDGDKKVAQYLTVVTEPRDGLPFDFNQIRVFTWNVKRHRYETAYRERMEGVLPVTVAQENFDKEGVLPAFVIRVKDDNGNVTERKYKLNTPIVRRVYAPGEEPVRAVSRKAVSKKAANRKAKRKR